MGVKQIDMQSIECSALGISLMKLESQYGTVLCYQK